MAITGGVPFGVNTCGITTKAGYLYLGTQDLGLYRTASPLFTPGSPTMAHSYSLYQNFPNPFNPVTTIPFTVPTDAFVTLKIYDVIGREVQTIVSSLLQAGDYYPQWNASGMPSGVYFYRLQAGATTITRRMLVLK
jgi:hypothetical protein